MPDYPLSIPIATESPAHSYQTFIAASRDGTLIFCHEWFPGASRSDAAVVVLLVHGIGMHGGPYGAIAHAFAEQGIALVVPDVRGHGRSQGASGCLAEGSALAGDFDAVFDRVALLYPRRPLFLAGESMGGLLAAEYARKRQDRIRGLMLVAPAFRLNPRRLLGPIKVGRFLLSGRVVIDAPELLETATRVQGFNTAKRADPFATPAVWPVFLFRLGVWGLRWPWAEGAIEAPMQLHLAGADRVLSNRCARRLYARRFSAGRAIEIHEWPDAYHTMLWDPVAPSVVTCMCDWALAKAHTPA